MTSRSQSQTGDDAALQDALEREAATREILQVISQSRSDTGPVFEAILENARRLCNAPIAMLSIANEERTRVAVPASLGAREAFAEALETFNHPIDAPLIAVRPIADGRILHMADCTDDDLYRDGHPTRVLLADVEGVRSILAVPMISDGNSIGAMVFYRREVQPFDDGQIELVKTFADQAAIAIEKVRQFRAIQTANAELQTRLEREAATGEVLGVISQFCNDEIPVFELILENTARLCRAPHAFLQLRNEANTHLEVAAQNFAASKFLDLLRANPISTQNNVGSISVRGMNSSTPTQYDDIRLLKGTELYTTQVGYAIDVEGMRTALFVPLIAEGEHIGVFVLNKLEVAPFTTDEISLVQTFAAQAVIAIESVKQFKALESLNASLESRVESQVGEIERMGRLKLLLSPAVADAVVTSGDERMLGSHQALIAVLFYDIRGFTAFCETAEPEETIEVLQTCREEMGKLINAHGAGVDHRSGDGIMVIFNDPLLCDDPAGDALRMAMAMRERMAELCKGWRRLGHRLGFGVGISLGYATMGMVGSEGRYDYTASGSAVNLAVRLYDEAADGEILLSPRAYAAVEEEFAAESTGEINLKGISAPVEIFRVTSTGAEVE